MARRKSTIAENWWDFTTLEPDVLADAARLSVADLEGLSRPGFQVVFYDTLAEFYLAEALEEANQGARKRLTRVAIGRSRTEPDHH